MAQRVTVEMTDDIDGTQAAETIAFRVNGTAYEIHLSKKKAANMRQAFGPISSMQAKRRVAVAPDGHSVTVTARRQCASGRSSRASRPASGAASRHLLSPNTRRPTTELELDHQISPTTLRERRQAGH